MRVAVAVSTMRMRSFSLRIALSSSLLLTATSAQQICAKSDNPSDCSALKDFATSLNYKGWASSSGWMTASSVCKWFGVKCSGGRVTEISLKANKLKGVWPAAIGLLSHLETLTLDGTQPSSYAGCVDTDFGYSDFPASFWMLSQLSTFSAENSCLGGALLDGPTGVGNLTQLTEFSIHQNRVGGLFPASFDAATGFQVLKLDRNPINGTVSVRGSVTELVPGRDVLASPRRYPCLRTLRPCRSLTVTFVLSGAFKNRPHICQSHSPQALLHCALPPPTVAPFRPWTLHLFLSSLRCSGTATPLTLCLPASVTRLR